SPGASLGVFGKPTSRTWKQMPSMATWCSVGVVGMIWVTDWKLILNYVPWINGKFRTDN
uniref:Cytochrome b-c1 complex subunit 10 n=1 Tax=Varanus komodoensis TaxID=61221 RepID=A0A8D2LBW5_VARKO